MASLDPAFVEALNSARSRLAELNTPVPEANPLRAIGPFETSFETVPQEKAYEPSAVQDIWPNVFGASPEPQAGGGAFDFGQKQVVPPVPSRRPEPAMQPEDALPDIRLQHPSLTDFPATAFDFGHQQEPEAAARDEPADLGILGESFGLMTPEEQQTWLRETRAEAESDIESGQRALQTLPLLYGDRSDQLKRDLASVETSITDAQKKLEELDKIERGEAPLPKKTGLRSGLENVVQSAATTAIASPVKFAGIVHGYGKKAFGSEAAPDETVLYQTGKQIDEFARSVFPGDVARADEFGQKLAHGIGSLTAFYGSGALQLVSRLGPKALHRIAQAGPFALGSALEGTAQFEGATEKMKAGDDVSEADRLKATLAGTLTGMSEALPVTSTMKAATAASKGGRLASKAKTIGKAAATGGAEEGAQEFGQSIASDVTAQAFYDPERVVGKTAAEEGLIGTILGAGAKGGGAAISEARGEKKPKASPPAEQQEAPEDVSEELPEQETVAEPETAFEEEAAEDVFEELPDEDVATADKPSPVESAGDLDEVAAVVDTDPTEAQKEAGNYRKASVNLTPKGLGLKVAIETPKGTERRGKDEDGKEWAATSQAHYGYIKGVEGKDGDAVDIYVGPELKSQQVTVVNQIDPKTGRFDEHKAIYGFKDQAEAEKAYRGSFSDKADRVGSIHTVPVEEFKAWLKDGDKTKEFAPVVPAPSARKGFAPQKTPLSNIADVRRWAKEKYGPNAKVSRYGKQYSIGIENGGVTDYVTKPGGISENELAELGFTPSDTKFALARGQTKRSKSATVKPSPEGAAADERSSQTRPAIGRESDATVKGKPETGVSARSGEGGQADGDRAAGGGLRDRTRDRITRQESASLDADGNVIVGRQSREGKTLGEGGARGLEDTMFALRGFYSPAIRAAENLNQKKGAGEQFWKQITKAPGVRKDELEWMGLEEFLSGKKSITKDEVLEFMRAHQVELDEKILTGAQSEADVTDPVEIAFEDLPNSQGFNSSELEAISSFTVEGEPHYIVTSAEDGRIALLDAQGGTIAGAASVAQAMHIAIGRARTGTLTKFEEYKVPGGENYRELLIRLPELGAPLQRTPDEIARIAEIQAELTELRSQTGVRAAVGNLDREFALKNELAQLQDQSPRYRSPHFQDQEIVHLRVDDRTGPNGEKVLFINEVQSDLHQRGRKRGYQRPAAEIEADKQALREAGADGKISEDEFYQRMDALEQELAAFDSSAPPPAPFKGDLWLELALKRALLYAAENGYDAISWARSDQIAKAVGGDAEALSVQYDQKIGRFLSKYTKKWGGKVEEARIPDAEGVAYKFTSEVARDLVDDHNGDIDAATATLRQNRDAYVRTESAYERALSDLIEAKKFEGTPRADTNPILSITPEMRASVLEGQPLAVSRDGNGYKLTAEATWNREKVFADIEAEISRMAPGVKVRFKDLPQGVEGAYVRNLTSIFVALRANDPQAIGDHEVIHAVRAMNLINDQEWVTLKNAAIKNGWVEKHNVREDYSDLIRERGLSEPEALDLMYEEAVAWEFSEWRKGKRPASTAWQRLFQRLNAFINRIMRALKLSKIEAFEQVFETIERGPEARQKDAARERMDARNREALTEKIIARFPGLSAEDVRDAVSAAEARFAKSARPTVEQQVSDAYWRLTQGPQEWVRLRELRAALPDIPRAELDAILKSMFLDKSINLTSEDDQGSLTQADRDASMPMGAQRIAKLSMESPVEGSSPSVSPQGVSEADDDVAWALSREQTKTPEFKRWFSDSKVVDENGEPLVVYHSTNAEFDAFDPDRIGEGDPGWMGAGFYFSADPAWTDQFGSNRMPVYLNLKNPFLMDNFDPEIFARIKKLDGFKEWWARTPEQSFPAVTMAILNKGAKEFSGLLKRSGYDGIVTAGEDGKPNFHGEIVVFEPTQIKSAIGNRGTFDPSDPRISYALSGRRTPSSALGKAYEEFYDGYAGLEPESRRYMRNRSRSYFQRAAGAFGSQLQSVRNTWQDNFLPVRRLEEAQKREQKIDLPENMQPYLREELYHSRLQTRIEDFEESHVEPLKKAIAESGIDLEQIEVYLYAKHAEERNKQIASINPKMQDGGSGMTTADAQIVLQSVQKSGKAKEYERIAQMVYAINDAKLDRRVEYGLMTQDEADTLRKTYANYVPLKGDPQHDDERTPPKVNIPKGFSVTNKDMVRAMGRRSRAHDLMARSVQDYLETMVRGERNRVAQALYEMLKSHPMPDAAVIDTPKMKRFIDKRTGMQTALVANAPVQTAKQFKEMVKEQADPLSFLDPNTMSVMVDGERHTIRFLNPELRDAMMNMGTPQGMGLMKAAWAFNRFIAMMATSLNPSFALPNFMRDFQAAGINIAAAGHKKAFRRVMGNSVRAMKSIIAVESGKGKGKWADLYRELKKTGGTTGFYSLKDWEKQQKQIEKDIRLMRAGLLDPSRMSNSIWGGFKDVVGGFNNVFENATRLAAYKIALDEGLSKEKAASLAKNITVNFNRRGRLDSPASKLVLSMYLFANPSIQGSHRLSQALKDATPARRYGILASLVGLGAMTALYNILIGAALGDDEEKNLYDTTSDYDRSNNWLLLNPFAERETGVSGRQLLSFKVPMPYGYGAIVNWGRLAMEYAVSQNTDLLETERTAGKTVGEMLSIMHGHFDPLGAHPQPLAAFAPTLAKPFVEMATNTAFHGGPIYPMKFDPSEPDSGLAFRTTPDVYKQMARWINGLGGGDDYHKGKLLGVEVDISPETLQHIWTFGIGGVGNEAARLYTMGERQYVTKEPIRLNDIPIMRRFVTSETGWSYSNDYYAYRDERMKPFEDVRRDAARGSEAAKDILPKLELEKRLYGPYKKADKLLSKYRKDIKANDKARDDGKIETEDWARRQQDLYDLRQLTTMRFMVEHYAEAKLLDLEKDDSVSAQRRARVRNLINKRRERARYNISAIESSIKGGTMHGKPPVNNLSKIENLARKLSASGGLVSPAAELVE